ncbi:MAG TPA: hypothetical protein VGC76_20170 [Pyrinomonadaceae bacterium]|jgi:hypothetical protein
MKIRWQFGIVAGIFLAIFTLYPQFKMLYLRGEDWQGHYAYNDIDEVAYASYVRALIDGRPRKNDPYTGRDDAPGNPQPESLFSIQFAAPYLIAIPARIFGVGAPWAMTAAGALAGFFAALAAFWLIARVTKDSWFAMAGSLVVLAGGALAAGEGAIGEILGTGYSYPYFPAFRRYLPAVPFPFFLAMCALVWLLVTTEDVRKRVIYGALASFCFAFTVFSYFYTWTTAVAWLICVAALWLIARPEGVRKDFKAFIALGAACLVSLAPYAYLLSKRAEAMDNVQLLVRTHAPDLTRFPEYISFVVILMLAAGIGLKVIEFKDRSTLFAFSFALVPLVVFNQQIITGRSLQPIHYQVFIGNYVAALGLVITVGLLWRSVSLKKPVFSKIAVACLAMLAIVWGFVECHYTVRILDEANVARDKALPLAKRLEELAKTDANPHQATVLHFGFESDDLPTVAPQNVLWARHQHVFAGLTWEESKERYYQFLYYSNLDASQLERQLMEGDFVSMIALFGWGRHTDRLTSEAKPLTYGEVAQEARRYGEYCRTFSLRQATNPTLSYVVVPSYLQIDLTNLDAWYERDSGERIGDYTLYKVKLKNF